MTATQPVNDTIAAPATPRGASALAVIRVSGPAGRRLFEAVFGRPPPAPRVICRADYKDVSGRVLDDTLATFFQSPKSYTGEDGFEISAHGNPLIVQLILNDLVKRGCRVAEPGEFTRRAFLAGRLDLSQAEAVADLIHARSERALQSAGRQLRGGLGRQLDGLSDQLLHAVAQVEAHIDFPEEDLPDEDLRQLAGTVGEVLRGTRRLLATQTYGDLLRDGIRVILLGAPNVGKSSLLNRLAGRDRALVSPEPGTTRDFIEEPVLLGGHLLRLMDTAGFNPAPGAIERLGMEKAAGEAAAAHLFLWVVDARQAAAPPALPPEISGRLTPDNALVLFNKADLSPVRQAAALPCPAFWVSALTGEGLGKAQAALAGLAERLEPETLDGEAIAINARHADALRRANEALSLAAQKLEAGDTSVLLASDLREALDAIGEIMGKLDNERVLDRIFSTFCIGK
ncbi:MAG: tRNA uridine-5-carboxymethylaminomethyl(34) synthesis GTPase MnmE [Opitutaceae bacterium]|jgi:tRNA modification GTPase|nr:tRNA uridine-5-carboxymethylaminomethyl(34) synthesis GTPase MnmE [Opitutaceae bacterium]